MSETKNKIDEAKELLGALEAKIIEGKEIIEKAERLKSEEILSGKAPAGQEPPKPLEENPKDYAKRIMAGKNG